MAPPKKIRLGDMLVEHGLITEDQLMTALSEQKKRNLKLGRTLIELNFITEDAMLNLLSTQLKIPFIDLTHYKYQAEVAIKVPETVARRYRVLALAEYPDSYMVGMADPTDLYAFDELSNILDKPVRQVVVRETTLLQTLDLIYRKTDEISNLAEELDGELAETDFDLDQLLESSDVSEAPVVRMLQSIFEDALQMGASDIHIEPDERVLRIRQRIDGVLHEQVMKERRIVGALVSRLKLMSGLNISERRLPQDGRFNARIKEHNIDIRISTMPIVHGESVVMRLLDQSAGKLDLSKIGMPDDILERFRHYIKKPHGMVLVTGPTGSGKTTTLYGALNELNVPEKKIITVEDPVEYRLPRVNQVQVHSQIGLDFATVLRTALRQDPDIVLVGEMRDQETAEIGLRASITGHLVLSTLHTNDAVSTAIRLVDMGIPGFMVATSLEAIIAQRLVRRVCEYCSNDYQPDLHELSWLKTALGEQFAAALIGLKQGQGCPNCNNTGYKGRIGVFELLEINDDLADALRSNDTTRFAQVVRNNRNFRSLSQHALIYAQQGITTLEEVIRVTGDETLTYGGETQAPAEVIEADPETDLSLEPINY